MIKKRRRKNPYLANVGYHATDSKNLESISEEGFVRRRIEDYYGIPADLFIISHYFFDGYAPIYFLDVADLEKIKNEMKGFISQFDLLLKVDVSKYDLQPDYNQLVIDYHFDILDNKGFVSGKRLPLKRDVSSGKYSIGIYKKDLEYRPYDSLQRLFLKYGHEFKHNPRTVYQCIPLSVIKNNDEIKEELIYFTDTFCVNKDIPPSKILEFYDIEN